MNILYKYIFVDDDKCARIIWRYSDVGCALCDNDNKEEN